MITDYTKKPTGQFLSALSLLFGHPISTLLLESGILAVLDDYSLRVL